MPDKTIPKAEIDPNATARAPKTRDEIVQQTQRPEVDARNPARKSADAPVDQAYHDPADIPAGPGDAGAQDAPRTLPKSLQRDRGGWGRVFVILSIVALIGIVMMLS